MMGKGLAFGLALLFAGLVCLAQAQTPASRFPPGVFQNRAALDGAAVSFAGSCDAVAAITGTFQWGTRPCSLAYSGNIFKVCDQATGLVCADATVASGVISVPTLGGNTCANSVTICVIDTFYDTSGNAGLNATQATNSKRAALIVPGASNGCTTDAAYCAAFVLANVQCYVSSGTITQAQPLSMSAIVTRTGSTTTQQRIFSFSVDTIRFNAAVNSISMTAGTNRTLTGVNDNAWHAIQAVFNGASSQINADGAGTGTVDAGSTGISAELAGVGGPGGAGGCGTLTLTGNLEYVRFDPAAYSAGNITSINTNAHAYPSAW